MMLFLCDHEYEPFGNEFFDTKKDNRLSWIGKERDKESLLGDFGARKYDFLSGRFTSIDPLWEEYYEWSPYQYSGNNPIRFYDDNGLAFYIDERGYVYDDGNLETQEYIYATHSEIINKNKYTTEDGSEEINWTSVQCSSYLFPSDEVVKKICDNHGSYIDGSEGGSVGDYYDFVWGGRSERTIGKQTVQHKASKEVEKAALGAKEDGICPTYYVHDHPLTASENPTYPQDFRAINVLNKKYSKSYQYGILISKSKVTFFSGLDDKGKKIIEPISIPKEFFIMK